MTQVFIELATPISPIFSLSAPGRRRAAESVFVLPSSPICNYLHLLLVIVRNIAYIGKYYENTAILYLLQHVPAGQAMRRHAFRCLET